MNKTYKYSLIGVATALLVLLIPQSRIIKGALLNREFHSVSDFQQDTSKKQSDLQFPLKKDESFPPAGLHENSSMQLENPENIKETLEFDPTTGEYVFRRKVGNFDYRPSSTMSKSEYLDYETKRSVREYWRNRAQGGDADNRLSFAPQFNLGGEAFDKVFGSNTINIIPQGSAELVFGFNVSKVDNPTLSEKLRRTPSFNFEEKIQMNVTGTIGERMKLAVNYNTEATFDFENKTKLEYVGEEDDIIKKIEAGNVTLPLTGSLITGSQSLFGLKTELQFGRLSMTNVFSQQKGETSVIEVAGGAQLNEFEVTIDDYDANKHFFLGQFFRDNYNRFLENLPLISSGINITRVEVWLTNKSNVFEDNRNIVAFMDLGEANDAEGNPNFYGTNAFIVPKGRNIPPSNTDANELYNYLSSKNIRVIANVSSILSSPDFTIGKNYEKIQSAQKLSPREYTINSQLGYISLNRSLNSDEVLAVAYEYTLNGKSYRVGELSTEGVAAPDALIVKLLKGTSLTPSLPTWDLMMKNIYSIGAYQVEKEDFILNVLYTDDETGTSLNYIPLPAKDVSKDLLLRTMELDNVNNQLDPYPDGMFDFIPNITINPNTGRVIFPLLEPFGRDLEAYFKRKGVSEELYQKYIYKALYDSTQTKARQAAEKNKFLISGTYKSSSSSEIPLNAMNVPQGSVNVTAGGIKLQENIDYTVDYTLGRVKILNQGLMQSGTPIRISLESNSLFNIQTKTLVGTHLDYRISEDFNIGATILNLTERPLTQKVNIGDEPISNTIWGFNTSYRTQSQFLTNLIDKLPFLETKTPSSIMLDGEFAHLIPGQSKAIGKNGISYIDDFEGSETSIELKSYPSWVLASTPQIDEFASLNNDLRYGFNRAKMAWYVIDPLFLRNNVLTPGHIKNNDDIQNNAYVREVYEKELFPNRNSPNNIPTNIPVLNLAFYPQERGPFNYDAEGINTDGTLADPKKRWGGIMREIQTNDFEAANVEYLEFWVMDPFVYDSASQGGELYFNLGEISEDILKDSRKFFENGLPTPSQLEIEDTSSVWGRVPYTQSNIVAFDNNPINRKYQDVGFDGLSDEQERVKFASFIQALRAKNVDPAVIQKIEDDPSGDNFHYFRGGDYDAAELGILERYKSYNGSDGNSPTAEQSDEQYPTTGSTLPNIEDINRDNTLNETEAYYQYKIDLRPENMEVGQNFIIDKVLGNPSKGDAATWYQFRIPITSYQSVINGISDFKSIRFMRMFLTSFEKPVILRFASIELVRGEWRKYNLSLKSGSAGTNSPQETESGFAISAVNIEENSGKTPVNYVLPPGIDRVIDPTNPQLRQLNEQAIVLKVSDIPDNEARAAFKTVSMDVRQYKKLKMFVHAEEIPGTILRDGELTAFIRLGSDYTDNYYEYEVPLKLTPPRSDYKDDKSSDRELVWPEENNIEIVFDLLQQAKQARNDAMRQPGSQISFTTPYPFIDGNSKITISGNPNLANIRVVMIGVRNPGDVLNNFYNDGLAKSGEIWMNELRLTDFNDKGGWAANARMTTKLADFGTITVAGTHSTPGFGSIEKKVNERSKEEITSYDVSTNLEFGKFFPEKARVSIPVYAGISEQWINPQYNPLDPDIPFKAALENVTPAEAKKLKEIAQDYTTRKSFNLSNVRVGPKPGKKPKIYDFSNWAASYSYSEAYHRDIRTEYNSQIRYRGALSYNFSNRPKNVTPFSKIKFLSKPAFKIIKDFNFYYLPTNLSFRTDMNKQYTEIQMRSLNNPYTIPVTVNKDFIWNRFYDLKFDLTRSLKLDFSATNISRIYEPYGPVNKKDDYYKEYKDSVWASIFEGGRTINYYHTINATYTVPINKLPFFDWVTLSARYNTTYAWDVAPVTPGHDLGNTIKNSNTSQLNGQLNLLTLYNKVGYLKKLNQPPRPGAETKEYKTVNFDRKLFGLKAGEPKFISHKLGTQDVKVTVLDETGQEVPGSVEVVNENRISFTPDNAVTTALVAVEGKVEKMKNPFIFIAENTTRILMGVKNISISYQQTEGTLLPGFRPKTTFLGMSNYYDDFSGFQSLAPGYEFILGIQDDRFLYNAYDKGWLSRDTLLINPYLVTYNDNFNIRGTIEPIPGFKVDVTMNQSKTENSTQYLGYEDGRFTPTDPLLSGNFTMSFISISSAFEKPTSENGYASPAFEDFKTNRAILAARLAGIRMREDISYDPSFLPVDERDNGFPYGYGPSSQDVLIPAFISAYGGITPGKVTLATFPSILKMLPNWRITYDGLSKIEFLKTFTNSVNLSHAYRSSYNIGSYVSNPEYFNFWDPNAGVYSGIDLNNNFIAENQISAVSITEQFSPLIGIDVALKNSLSTRFEIKKSRNLNLSLINNQIMEIRSDEYVVGMGYRFNKVPFVIRSNGGQKNFESDLNVRADLSFRDNKTILRRLIEDDSQASAGQNIITFKFTADYVLSDRFNLRFFFDRIVNKLLVSNSYNTSNTNVGFSVRFTLVQ